MFAKVGQVDEKLFVALAGAAEQQVSEFNAKVLASTAWAFAKVGHLNEKLFTALARSL